MDDVTANTVMYAVRLLAADSRSPCPGDQGGRCDLAPDSYGASNRHVIASRHERIAYRLRALEGNYHDVTTTPGKPERGRR